MPSITNIAKSDISRETARITTASFDFGLYLADADSNLDGQDYYVVGSPDEVLDISGITTTSSVYLAAAAYFSGSVSPDRMVIGQVLAADADAGAALARIRAAGISPYYVAVEARDDASRNAVATYVSAQRMFHISVSNATDDMDTVGSTALTLNQERTLVLFEDGTAADTYNDLRLMGFASAATAGSWVASSLLVNGAVSVDVTEGQYAQAIANRTNFFSDFGGNIVLQDGKASSGEWMDIIVNLDWVDARLEEALALLKIKRNKVGYTEKGLSLERLAIMDVLGKAQDLGIFASWNLTTQSAASQGADKRGTREYDGHEWEAQLEGAIQYTVVKGKVGA